MIKNIIFVFIILFVNIYAFDDDTSQRIYNTYKKIEHKPTDLHSLYLNVYLDEEKNQILNLMKLGLYSYQKKYYEDAKWAFDVVLNNIESLNIDNDMTDKATSLWHGESEKLFVGEPYERVMAYYYRGLLYLKEDDYENARASFKSGILQDSRVENETYQADFQVLLLLDALSSKINGDEEMFKSAKQEFLTQFNNHKQDSLLEKKYTSSTNIEWDKLHYHSPDNTIHFYGVSLESQCKDYGMDLKSKPTNNSKLTCIKSFSYNYRAANKFKIALKNKYFKIKENIKKIDYKFDFNNNLFLIIDTGYSPKKYTSGKADSELNFKRSNHSSNITPIIEINNKFYNTKLLDDLYFQASTRGGRGIDKIIEGKVAWKDSAITTSADLDQVGDAGFGFSGELLANYESTGSPEADALYMGVALTFAAIGAVGKVGSYVAEEVGNAVVTTADARYWNTIPGQIYLYSIKLPEGKHTLLVKGNTQTSVEVIIKNGDTKVLHISDNSIKPKELYRKNEIKKVITNAKYVSNYNDKEQYQDKTDLIDTLGNLFSSPSENQEDNIEKIDFTNSKNINEKHQGEDDLMDTLGNLFSNPSEKQEDNIEELDFTNSKDINEKHQEEDDLMDTLGSLFSNPSENQEDNIEELGFTNSKDINEKHQEEDDLMDTLGNLFSNPSENQEDESYNTMGFQ